AGEGAAAGEILMAGDEPLGFDPPDFLSGRTVGVVPVSRSLFICEGFIGTRSGGVDLVGLFNLLPVSSAFPYRNRHFSVYAQLTNGLGQLPVFVEIRDAETDNLIRRTEPGHVTLPNRLTIVQVVVNISGCVFPRPGIYLVELFCNNVWVCDTTLRLRE